jgi:hypothetical protein
MMDLGGLRDRCLAGVALFLVTGCSKSCDNLASEPQPAPSATPPTAPPSSAAPATSAATPSRVHILGPPPAPSSSAAWAVEFPRDATEQERRWGCTSSYATCVVGETSTDDLSGCREALWAPCPFTSGPARPSQPCASPLEKEVTRDQRRTYPTACCYLRPAVCTPPNQGRPLRSAGGVPLVAERACRADWLSPIGPVEGRRDPAAAAAWTRAAALEHASIASFARASLQLIALGAPADLVLGAHAAALDEVRHAADSYAVASRYAGADVGPGALDLSALPATATTLVAFALETFRDGCVNETLAAVAASEAAELATGDEAGILRRIAEDEARHAALAWKMVAWAVAEGGDAVRDALGASLDELERGAPPGIVMREVILPCARAVLTAPSERPWDSDGG